MLDTKKRIEWVDIAKGIGIILVIMGHTIALQYSRWLYAFHLPLFFLLSGFVYNTSKYERYATLLKEKGKQVLYPWLKFFLAGLIVCLIIPEWRNTLSMRQILFELYTTNTNNIQNSSIWYLICLFMTFNIFYFVNKMKKTWASFAVLAILAVLLLWQKNLLVFSSNNILNLPDNRLPLKIDSALVASVFFAVGVWNRKRIVDFFENTSLSCFKLVIAATLVFAAAVLNGWTNLNSLDFGRIHLLFYPIALGGIFVICYLSAIISKSKFLLVKKILLLYGKNSLLLFGTQSIFIRLYLYVFNKFEGLNMELYMNNPLYHQIGSFIVVAFVISPLLMGVNAKIKGIKK